MEKNNIMKVLLPALAGALLLSLILYLVLGPNPAEKTSTTNSDPTQSAANKPIPETQKSKDISAEGMAKEYPADTDEGYVKLEGGLKYKDIKIGEGDEAPAGCMFTSHYAGWQTNGNMFDSTYLKGQPPMEFSLNGVIPGWTKGLPGMKPGGIRRLIIPASMAYGNGEGGRPGGTLVFEVKLTKWR